MEYISQNKPEAVTISAGPGGLSQSKLKELMLSFTFAKTLPPLAKSTKNNSPKKRNFKFLLAITKC
ncbi:MAG: hypothetical protein KBD43_09000, partial [Saprospiraceae bacterium]|nr:hypothetical protein [Saprospiraceae bacterium]